MKSVYIAVRIGSLNKAVCASTLEGLDGTLLIINMVYWYVNILKPTGLVMHHQFNIQQLYALPTLYLCVLYLPDNKQRLVPLTA